uniref:WAS/WASL interacting protein family member 3 n=1 Tax=Neogobius melanostomus TaxID=47308 RepID=A0A8C6T7X4_9GOBI
MFSSSVCQCPEPPRPPALGGGGGGGGGRNALLADIQRGARLRKVTQVNDRSAPTQKSSPGDGSGAPQGSTAGAAPMGPSLGGLFAGGFPTLRPIGQRDFTAKNPGLWSLRTGSASKTSPAYHRPLVPSSSAPPSPSHGSRLHPLAQTPPPAPASPPPPPPPLGPAPAPPAPLSAPPPAPLLALPPPPPPLAPPPPPPQAHRPPLPSGPPPPPPSSVAQVTRPTWLPVQSSAPPPPPPPPPPPLSYVPGDRSSGVFYPPPPQSHSSELSRCSPLGPPPPPPPLPASFTPTCPSSLPPPPPKVPPVPSPAMRSLPPSYPCHAPTRRPPAVPRPAGRSSIPKEEHMQNLTHIELSKFQFHPVEDFPTPEEFRPFPRVYPSKENRGTFLQSPQPSGPTSDELSGREVVVSAPPRVCGTSELCSVECFECGRGRTSGLQSHPG